MTSEYFRTLGIELRADRMKLGYARVSTTGQDLAIQRSRTRPARRARASNRAVVFMTPG